VNSTAPSITVSSLDLERIEALLEQPQFRTGAGIDALLTELKRANVLEPAEMPGDIVTMNSTAQVTDEATGEQRELTLVYPREADSASNKVSVFAPVGMAMLGMRVGQVIDWKVPGGRELRLRITAISFQPEASGQLHR
jgi:regulator of nucleoside diphosphate kinase